MGVVRFTRRLLVLLGLLTLPVLLALASQFLAERPGAPELPSRDPVRVGPTSPATPANPMSPTSGPTGTTGPTSPGAGGNGYAPEEDVDEDGIDDDIEIVAPEGRDD